MSDNANNDNQDQWFAEVPDSVEDALGREDWRSPNDPEPYKLPNEHSLAEIMQMEFEDHPLPCLTRDDVFAIGASHLFAAPPKSGKSTLARRLSQDWCLEGHGVLYLSEEWERVWKRQATELDLGVGAGVYTVVPALGVKPARLCARALDGPEDIIIVDTTRALMGIHSLGNSDEVVSALRPWLQLCQSGKTLIMLHHMIKSTSRRFGVAVAGGHGLQGAVDTIIQYSEVGDNMRLVEVRSRLASENVSFIIRKTGSMFSVEDAPNELTLTDPEREVFAVLNIVTSDASVADQLAQSQTLQELMEATDFREAKLRRILLDLSQKGLVRDVTGHAGRGGRGNQAAWVAVEDEDDDDGA